MAEEVNAKQGHAAHVKVAENLGIFDSVQRPLKIVFLGAGSMFLEHLAKDVLGIPGADEGEFALVDIDRERLEMAEALTKIVIERMGKSSGWTVTATTERREVLAGADYIINCIEVSGAECVHYDNGIPLRYGVDQCIGDTIGPGGLFKALRTVPVFLDVLKDVEELCPAAWVLNYTNPMSMMCLAASRASSAKVVGLCHSVQGTSHQLADCMDIPYAEMTWRCAGINHLAWFTELSRNGEDLYPLLFERSNDPETWEKDPIRFDMMRHFGRFVTESSGHFSEYVPYYRKKPELIKEYCRSEYRGQSGFYADNWPQWRKDCDQRRRDIIAGDKEPALERSWEYASVIIEASETNRPFIAYCTVPNAGLITNLPADGVVEVACVVDKCGITPTHFGRLEPQLAALCDANMRMFDLAADACIHRSRELATHALMLDPLTAAVCCPSEIKQMTEELFEAEKDFLPGF
ncbi:MAG: alpha-galactosidase [Phycisphaerae bacterium]|nr:alpha-galactosidase [Phycisphaerae bacterium]